MKTEGAVSCTKGAGVVRNAQSLATRALKGHIGARDRGLRPSPENDLGAPEGVEPVPRARALKKERGELLLR